MNINSFMDPQLDKVSKSEREKFLLSLIQKQLKYAYENVDFYRESFDKKGIKPSDIKTIEDFRKLPILKKETVRKLGPYGLLPKKLLQTDKTKGEERIFLNRGTGGTTGEPTSMFWTYADWKANTESIIRMMDEIKIKHPLIAFNGYNQGHIAGPAFDAIIRMLNGITIPRHFSSDDEKAMQQMEKYKANVLIATPQSGSKKGGSIVDFLNADKNGYINGKNVFMIIHSSTPMTDELIQELAELDIHHIVNIYGSTDAFPTAINCQADKHSLHITNGNVLLEVVNEKGEQVKSGERGFIVISRIGSSTEKGIDVSKATQLFRFLVGDEATYIEEKCACGRTTPKIKDVQRVLYVQDKLEGGCEVW